MFVHGTALVCIKFFYVNCIFNLTWVTFTFKQIVCARQGFEWVDANKLNELLIELDYVWILLVCDEDK